MTSTCVKQEISRVPLVKRPVLTVVVGVHVLGKVRRAVRINFAQLWCAWLGICLLKGSNMKVISL